MHASGRRGEWTRHSLCIFSLDRRRQASSATVVPQRKCSLTAAGCALITATMLGSRSLGAQRCNLLRKCSTGRSLACRAGVAPAGAVSARRSPRGELSEHGARHVRGWGRPRRAQRGAAWPAALAPSARRRRSSDPIRASRSVQVHSAVQQPTLQRETLGAHASKRALGTSRLAQFACGLCTVRLHSSYRRHSASRGADVGARAAEPSNLKRIFANLEPLRDRARERVP
jgi:hypothetical protein